MSASPTQSREVMAALAPEGYIVDPSGVHPDGAHHAAGAHAGGHGGGRVVHLQPEQAGQGPVMAEVRIAGSQMRGLRTMLPIWSMEVPRP